MLNIIRSETCIICGLSAGDTFFRKSESLRLGNISSESNNSNIAFLMRNTCRNCLVNLPLLYPQNTWTMENSGLTVKAFFMYEEPINKMLLHLKFYHHKYYASWIAQIIYLTAQKYWTENKSVWLVPVPLGSKRLQERGFNQAAEIAKYIAEFANVKLITDLLIRVKETKRQTETKNRAGRLVNMKDAFVLNPKYDLTLNYKTEKPQSVLLFDDISTTGITLNEAAKPLLVSGYEVKALVVATEHQVGDLMR